MKTKTTYQMNVKRTTVILIAGLFLMQASLTASDGAKLGGSYYIEEAVDAEYEIEPWMSDVYSYALIVKAADEEMELEEWMYNTQHSFWLNPAETADAEPEIESWMANPEDWKIGNDEVLLSLR